MSMSSLSRILLAAALVLSALPGQAFQCPTPPAGIVDIKGIGYYTDAAHSVIDEAKLKENNALIKPLRDFNRKIADMSDAYVAEKDAEQGACAIAWLDRWAQDGAILGEMVRVNNDQADYERQWLLGGFAIVYLKTRTLADVTQRTHIEDWLREIARRNLAYWDNLKHTRNNHYYWTGVGIMATAVASGDADLLQHARSIYEKGIGDIAGDGTLDMEMARGRRALHYHNFALDPLVMIAEISRKIGQDWYAYKDRRIDLLADRVAAGFKDPGWFAQRAGKAQEPVKYSGEEGWVEFYRLRAPHPERFDDLHAHGPFREPRTGGNMSAMAAAGVFDPK